jgi:hypothetical protein
MNVQKLLVNLVISLFLTVGILSLYQFPNYEISAGLFAGIFAMSYITHPTFVKVLAYKMR